MTRTIETDALLAVCERGCGRRSCEGCTVARDLMAEGQMDEGTGPRTMADIGYDVVVLGGLALVIWALAVM